MSWLVKKDTISCLYSRRTYITHKQTHTQHREHNLRWLQRFSWKSFAENQEIRTIMTHPPQKKTTNNKFQTHLAKIRNDLLINNFYLFDNYSAIVKVDKTFLSYPISCILSCKKSYPILSHTIHIWEYKFNKTKLKNSIILSTNIVLKLTN